MPAKIETTICNGELIAATREMIQTRLEDFAAADRLVKALHVSVDLGNRDQPVVEIKAPIGEQQIVSQGKADKVVQAVEDAIRNLERKLAERQKEQGEKQESEEQKTSIMQLGGALAGILFAGIFCVLFVRTVSCTSNPANYPPTASVEGTVTLDGEPLDAASVAFTPSEGGRQSSGVTDANGKYTLQYTGAIEGAMLGTHRVAIMKALEDPDNPDLGIPIVPEQYYGMNSELSAEVKDGSNTLDFDLTSK